MRELPALFSAPMVRRILDESKTKTRRVMRPQPERLGIYTEGVKQVDWCLVDEDGDPMDSIKCPYGAPGDRLWVREAWCLADPDYPAPPADGRPVGPRDAVCWYRATEPDVESVDKHGRQRSPWRPSIHMPRWASRITLDVTAVRVERLQEITEEGARAEGVESDMGLVRRMFGADALMVVPTYRHSAHYTFRALWDRINGERAPWSSNPWVWVVEFKVAAASKARAA